MKNRRWLILIIIGLLLIPFNLFVPDVSAGVPVSDGEVPVDGSQLSWNDTLSELCINLSDAEGDGMEYTISQNSVVLESGGTFVYTNTTHNFTDTTNNSAYWESSPTSLRLTGETEFTVGEYQNISGWSYYKKITTDHTLVDADLINFPVLFSNTSSDFISHAQTDGDDFVFVSIDGSTKYNHEIENYNSTTGELIAWVNITSLSSSVDTELYLYYGNSDCSSQQNITGTWNSDFIAVWHWNSSFLDSTSNSYDGIPENLVNTTGIVAGGLQNSRTEDRSVIVNNFYDSSSDNTLTAEMWIKFDDNDELYPRIFSKSTSYNNMDWGYYFRGTDNQEHRICVNNSFSVQGGTLPGNYGVGCFGFWFYSWATINVTDQYARAYYNTTNLFNYNGAVEMNITNDHTTLYIANDQAGESWNGKFDETRVSKIVRSWEWMNTTFNTIYNSATFLSINSEQSGTGVNTSSCVYPYSHHYFVFNLSEYNSHNITNIDVNWYGYAGYKTSGAKPKWYWDASLHVKKGSWGSAANQTPSPYTGDPVLEWINYSFDNGHIHSDGTVHIAIENTVADDCSRIYTDYIELIVTTIGGGVGNGTYCTSNVSWWNDTCGTVWSWVVYVDDGRDGSSSTTYTFTNAPCVFSGTIYPTSGSVGVCPCSDAICIDVTADYKFNMTIYGREQGSLYWHVWNSYTNISADEYCFCMDAIHPTIRSHAVFHRHVALPITVIDIWYNVTSFEHGISKDMVINDDHIVIPSHGRYAITYWAAVRDDDANPTGHKMAIRVTCNDAEIDGSYRELFFTNQGYEMHLSGQVQDEFFEDDIIRFQYIGDDTDQEIATYGTWSDDNICYYGYIRKTGMEEHHPLMFNTTYEWYVNVSKFDNSSLYNQTDVFSFTTASERSACVSSSGGGSRNNYMSIIGLCGLFAIPVSFILYGRLKKRKRLPPSHPPNGRFYYRNY